MKEFQDNVEKMLQSSFETFRLSRGKAEVKATLNILQGCETDSQKERRACWKKAIELGVHRRYIVLAALKYQMEKDMLEDVLDVLQIPQLKNKKMAMSEFSEKGNLFISEEERVKHSPEKSLAWFILSTSSVFQPCLVEVLLENNIDPGLELPTKDYDGSNALWFNLDLHAGRLNSAKELYNQHKIRNPEPLSYEKSNLAFLHMWEGVFKNLNVFSFRDENSDIKGLTKKTQKWVSALLKENIDWGYSYKIEKQLSLNYDNGVAPNEENRRTTALYVFHQISSFAKKVQKSPSLNTIDFLDKWLEMDLNVNWFKEIQCQDLNGQQKLTRSFWELLEWMSDLENPKSENQKDISVDLNKIEIQENLKCLIEKIKTNLVFPILKDASFEQWTQLIDLEQVTPLISLNSLNKKIEFQKNFWNWVKISQAEKGNWITAQSFFLMMEKTPKILFLEKDNEGVILIERIGLSILAPHLHEAWKQQIRQVESFAVLSEPEFKNALKLTLSTWGESPRMSTKSHKI